MIGKGNADVNDTKLFYELGGEGQTIVFIHGFTLDHRMWDDQFRFFTASFQVLRYDVRGYGTSEAPSSKPYSHHEDLYGLMRLHDLDKVHLVGLSMGGGIAINYALQYPETLHSLTLLDSSLGGFNWKDDWNLWGNTWPEAQKSGIQAAKDLWMKSRLFETLKSHPEMFKKLSNIVNDFSGWCWVNSDPGTPLDPPAITRLESISIPTQILVGELDQPDFKDIATLLAANIPNSIKSEISNAGHMVNLEAPEEVNEILSRFFASFR
ncbi:MAG: alpha/beta fold hydrolase [Candidatus Kariarchaeaceae archaeon]|jgi:pimeloyl-ACP methyl ester carboxylesterase